MATESEQVRILRENELLKDENDQVKGEREASIELIRRLMDKLEQAQAENARLKALAAASLGHLLVCADSDPPEVLRKNLEAALADSAREGVENADHRS